MRKFDQGKNTHGFGSWAAYDLGHRKIEIIWGPGWRTGERRVTVKDYNTREVLWARDGWPDAEDVIKRFQEVGK